MSISARRSTNAILIHLSGGPEVLQLAEIALPPPAQDEAQVRHAAIGVNYIDVYFRTALYTPPGYPFVPGLEGAGVVEAIGANVRDVQVGDRVAYAARPLGAYAERRNVPADRLVKLPAHVDEKLAAAMMLKGMSAHYLLRRVFEVKRGHTILIHAAAGGVGSLVCQWAHHLGAIVIGTVGSDAKAERARANGCDHPIVYTREKFGERVKAITDGRGVDVVYDSVGKDTFDGSIACLAPLGMLVSFGQSSGSVPPFDIKKLAQGSLFLTRPSLLDYTAKREDLVRAASELFDVVAKGIVRCTIERTHALKDAAQAHRELEGRATTGSMILIP
jgi:NADPH2:quinone reductase